MRFSWTDAEEAVETQTRAAAPQQELSPEAMAQRIEEEKKNYARMMGLMTAMLSDYREEVTAHLPGTVTEVKGFHREGNTIDFAIEGDKILAGLEKMGENEEMFRQVVVEGIDLNEAGPPGLEEEIFGVERLLEARVTGKLQPLFGYEQELAQARDGYTAMLKGLGFEQSAIALSSPPAKGEGFSSLKVAGLRLVREGASEMEMRPFNHDPQYTLALVGELPGAVLAVSEGKVTRALTDRGTSLLPEKEWDRKINWPKLSKSKDRVAFEVQLKLPAPEEQRLQELAGTLQYQVASGTREMDLGLLPLAVGSKGSGLGAEITEVGESQWNKGATSITLHLKIAKDAVAGVRFVSKEGTALPFEPGGTTWGGNDVHFTFNHKGELPGQARILVEVHQELKSYTITWQLSDLPLTCLP